MSRLALLKPKGLKMFSKKQLDNYTKTLSRTGDSVSLIAGKLKANSYDTAESRLRAVSSLTNAIKTADNAVSLITSRITGVKSLSVASSTPEIDNLMSKSLTIKTQASLLKQAMEKEQDNTEENEPTEDIEEVKFEDEAPEEEKTPAESEDSGKEDEAPEEPNLEKESEPIVLDEDSEDTDVKAVKRTSTKASNQPNDGVLSSLWSFK
ncbi:hypothetical protein ThvES_00020240 [Thiovulum sp. ES]|nr:hypothetical protein ThvES_00020240 [Thiovulum sp. ES]